MSAMTLEQFYYIGELVAAVAVIVSLIYVSIQIRQNTSIMKINSAQYLSHELRESLSLLVSNGEMSDIHLRAMRNVNDLNPGEKFRFYIFLNNVFRVYENAYYQNSLGSVDPAVWGGMVGNMKATKAMSGYEAFWKERKNIFNKKFQSFYESELSGMPNLLDAFQEAKNQPRPEGE